MEARGPQLFKTLLLKELRREFQGTISGWFWFIVSPLLMLAVYSFLFGVIFAARAPADLNVPFVAWLAVGLWPWLAFSDGILRGGRAIRQNAALISKVALPRLWLSISTQAAAYLLQLVGFAVVLLALVLLGIELSLASLPYLLLIMLSLYLFSLGLALAFSAIQVFLRDIEQLLPTLLLFWFFLTPILYAPELMPERMRQWMQLNPMLWWVEEIRAALFAGKWLPDLTFLVLLLTGIASLWVGVKIFDRLSPHFEDFL